jgi:hypothetical protein
MTDLLGMLIANTAKATNPRPDQRSALLVDVRGALAALLIGAVIFAILDRWRATVEDARARRSTLHFRSLYDRGEISREEFERIRARLGGKLRQELQLPQPRSPRTTARAEPGGNGDGAPNA